MKIGFVVDSGCDVPPAQVAAHSMTVIPLYINYGGESYGDDGVNFDRLAYYQKLRTLEPLPKTSAPSIGVARERVHAAFEGVDHLICVTIAANLSATHDVIKLATEGLPQGHVTMWDTGTFSLGSGWQALIGAESVTATNGDLDAVLAAMDRARENTMVYAGLQNLEHLRRGGRISWATAAVGGMLQLRPIIRVYDGAVRSAARVRGHRAWVEQLAVLVRSEGPLDRLGLLHTDNPADLEHLREKLADILPETVVTVVASPAIGTHTGPSGIGVATVRKTWRE